VFDPIVMKLVFDYLRPKWQRSDIFKSQVVEELYRTLDRYQMERTEFGYRRSDGNGTTTLSVVPQEWTEGGITIVGFVEVSTAFHDSFQLSQSYIQKLNGRAVFGAFHSRDGKLHLTAQYPLAAKEPHVPTVMIHVLNAFSGQLPFGFCVAESFLQPEMLKPYAEHHNRPREWRQSLPQDAFDAAVSLFRKRGHCYATRSGFTLEIPMFLADSPHWGDPSVQTARLRVSADVVHPIAGVGYLATITLPVRSRDVAEIASRLNEAELGQPHVFPRFGAWGVRGFNEQLVYSSFLPLDNYISHIHETLMAWMFVRALWIQSHFRDHTEGLSDRLFREGGK
jgi:hypothetical protein